MAAIRNKDTQPEKLVRKSLHAAGWRFRLHQKNLPGRPDIVLPRHRIAILVNGCFFHGHNCSYFKWPKTRPEFWHDKISANRARDVRNLEKLYDAGWRVLTVWECALRGPQEKRRASLQAIDSWLCGSCRFGELTELNVESQYKRNVLKEISVRR